MGNYDVKRLDVAIQYINRMTSGRNPVTNRPAPENEVLMNPNVHRCLEFISEVLQDVRSQGGVIGKQPGRSTAPKVSIAQTFPYEVLNKYQYLQDQQISYFLKQISELSTEGQVVPAVPAVHINNWLREKGYLEKRMVAEFGKETSVPTEKGTQIGIYSERAGIGSNQYYRIWFNLGNWALALNWPSRVDCLSAFGAWNWRVVLYHWYVRCERFQTIRRKRDESHIQRLLHFGGYFSSYFWGARVFLYGPGARRVVASVCGYHNWDSAGYLH